MGLKVYKQHQNETSIGEGYVPTMVNIYTSQKF